ncbi:UAA transporter [Pelagophyceae sp. CCMP2097]|nr:UAA transporter [Pelagophyceae sp. CCMP2097]|mmetsp:Transcript_10666/g.35398  ORF Transcript_10666/g.35398 Transcript_10666/m.35398 type:complete len:371 (-) Transcript_10666:51-1163(-)
MLLVKVLALCALGAADVSKLAPKRASKALSRRAALAPATPIGAARGVAACDAAVARITGGAVVLSEPLKLILGAGGIYAAFLYYGSLQEDVFLYTSADGSKFKEVWFLQVLEAVFNTFVGGIGLWLTPGARALPQKLFACTGATQVFAKYCTNAALANGVSFPVATLAKSGKMVPVMLGSLLLGGASYSARQCAQVFAIVAGTALVSMSKKKASGSSSNLGFAFIVSSLVFDGITGGVQNRIKTETKAVGVKPQPYDYMFYTNLYMLATASAFALARGEVQRGTAFCVANPIILTAILKVAVCSAVGQSFIFYTIANFDPLVCTTVTTTRKIFSVLLSIVLKGHKLNGMGWAGVTVACAGIVADALGKRH